MKNRPWTLYSLALVYIAIALSMPLQVLMMHEHPFAELGLAITKLTALNWILITGLIAGGIVVFRGSPWMVPIGVSLIFLVTLNNFIVSYFGEDFSLPQTLSASFLFAGVHGILLHPTMRKLFADPGLRWWRTARRYDLKVPVAVRGPTSSFTFETLDISETGLFLPLSEGLKPTQLGLELNEQIQLQLKFGTLHQIKCHGKVVRHGKPNERRPEGLGIQFTQLSAKERRRLKRYLQDAQYHDL